MLVIRRWRKVRKTFLLGSGLSHLNPSKIVEGWFLFGVIPIFIRDVTSFE